MKTPISFYTDSTEATEKYDCVVHFSMSGTKEAILHRLKETIRDIEVHGKPIQGSISAFNGTSHVITPIWKGQEY